MKRLILMLLFLGGTVQAGQAVRFLQNGLPVSSVAANTDYVIAVSLPGKKDTDVDLCVQLAPDLYHCIELEVGYNGLLLASSQQDPSGCKFELSADLLCDYTPRTLSFSVQKPSTGQIIATGDLVID